MHQFKRAIGSLPETRDSIMKRAARQRFLESLLDFYNYFLRPKSCLRLRNYTLLG
jgi:hypothetical protein